MIKAMRVGMTVVCVINEKMYKKTFTDSEEITALYEKALNTDERNEEELTSLIADLIPPKTSAEIQFEKELEANEQKKGFYEWIEELRKNNDDEHFEIVGLKLYIRGINITVPEFLAMEFYERRNNQEDLSAMLNFWRRMALNPDPRCREDLYKFLINNKLTVTPSGYFVAYRNADVKETNNRWLSEFVGAQYAKIKAQKKAPRNYFVYWDSMEDEYFLKHKEQVVDSDWELQGDLQELYENVSTQKSQGAVYTDAHSRSTTIILGNPVKINRSECDANPDRTCSRGLHLGSTNFMRKGYFGEVGLICLCDPMDVVAVPYTDGQKLRTSEYLPIAIAEYDENGEIIPVDTATFEYEYAKLSQQELEDMLNSSTLESLKEHDIIPKEISFMALKASINGLKDSLEEMTKVVSERIQTV